MNEVKDRAPAGVVTHGGAGGPRANSDACDRACEGGVSVLAAGATALEAAIRATVVLEDDPRLNAGTGSNLRLDGKTIEMDAAVMDHRLRSGAVAIQKVRNPVEVARRVMDTQHLLLCGEGATAFARSQGVPEFDPISDRARERFARVQAFLVGGEDTAGDFPGWNGRDLEAIWNFPVSARQALGELAGPSDTVGAVARDANGHCAVASSTGGTSIMLLGRVGDTPVIGGGFYAGPAGAVAATGDGEEIMRLVLSKQVYDEIAAGAPAQEAVERGVAAIPERFTVGIIALSARDHGIADNRTMPSSVRHLDRS